MKVDYISFGRPELTPVGRDRFQFVKPMPVYIKFINEQTADKYLIPIGFETDFGSVPWIAQPLIPKNGDWDISVAYFIHDWNYTIHKHSRKYSDELLYVMLIYAGMNKFKAKTVWQAVNLFGKSAWDKGFDPKYKTAGV